MKPKCAECHFYAGTNFCAHCGRPTKEGAALESEEVLAEGWAIQSGPYYEGKRRTPHLCFSVFEDSAAYIDEAESKWAAEFGWKALGRVRILAVKGGEA